MRHVHVGRSRLTVIFVTAALASGAATVAWSDDGASSTLGSATATGPWDTPPDDLCEEARRDAEAEAFVACLNLGGTPILETSFVLSEFYILGSPAIPGGVDEGISDSIPAACTVQVAIQCDGI